MVTFIDELVEHLLATPHDLASVEIILPSKRAGTLFKKKLAQKLDSKTTFLPGVRSIEELIVELSGLVSASQTHLQFELYTAYLATQQQNPDSFLEFLAWAPGLLGDFNEIDRYLLPTNRFFDYLSAIKDLEHWSADPEPTPLVKNYIEFWDQIARFYTAFNSILQNHGSGYQGMQYRKAARQAENYILKNDNYFIFAGFNALNTAEQQIIQTFLDHEKAEIVWDIDHYFLSNKNISPGRFINEYLKDWPYYKVNELPEGSNYYLKEKNIKSVAVSGNIGQAKYIGQLVGKFTSEELAQTAIVLGDEHLLLPLLSALPATVDKINITMGLPLSQVPDASFYDSWLSLQQNTKEASYNSRDVLAFLGQSHVSRLLNDHIYTIRKEIESKNLLYIKASHLIQLAKNDESAKLLFKPWENNVEIAINAILEVTKLIKNLLIPAKNWLQLEYLFSFQEIFNQLEELLKQYDYLQDVKTLHYFYRELLASETLDFRGDPYEGLQIMGVLESRVLDFKNVIVTGLNEGVLPAGKSPGSFIPFDLKKEYKLPTFREKDAIYSYHFFRLLQRAEQVYLLYNNTSTGLNSAEKSRFLLQLELENHPQHNFKEVSASAQTAIAAPGLKKIEKTPEIIAKIKEQAAFGFSPSALTTYIRNPIDFYYRYVLGIKELDRVEEVVAHNTLGTIVHESLEQLYTPYLNQEMDAKIIKTMRAATAGQVEKQFEKIYNLQNTRTGKNLIIYNVAQQFIGNLLHKELHLVEEKHDLKIKQCERQLNVLLTENDNSVRLRGTVDRIDLLDGVTRIIDYKTGKVEAAELKLKDWELLTTDYKKHAKAFQVLCYALMMQKAEGLPENLEAGIISFKNLQSGFLAFQEDKSKQITPELLATFEVYLLQLIHEILDINIPFTEKAVE